MRTQHYTSKIAIIVSTRAQISDPVIPSKYSTTDVSLLLGWKFLTGAFIIILTLIFNELEPFYQFQRLYFNSLCSIIHHTVPYCLFKNQFNHCNFRLQYAIIILLKS